MSDHLRMYSAHPVNGAKTEFVCWYDENETRSRDDYAGRAVFNICTGVATLHSYLSLGECRALASHLLAMADAIEADTTVFQPKGDA
jgi:hypothetical protein